MYFLNTASEMVRSTAMISASIMPRELSSSLRASHDRVLLPGQFLRPVLNTGTILICSLHWD
jgi:hypothetical protein